MGLNPIGGQTYLPQINSSYEDPYLKIFRESWGALCFIETTFWSISDNVFKGKESHIHAQDLIEYADMLINNAKLLNSLRSSNKNPSSAAWGGNKDDLISKCDLLKKQMEEAAKDEHFIDKWHFRNILSSLEIFRNELFETTKKFGWGSLYK